ncbi:MAG: tRNA uracil 4-sulfurtransferase ThiI [Candidatus Pacearchaeota archaeon]
MKILLHVSGEIGTKGKNRIKFERKLGENIKKKIENVKIKRAFGSFLIDINKKDKEKIKKIPGIAWIAEVLECKKNLNGLKNAVLKLIKENNIKEFDIKVNRSWKGFKYNSQEIRDYLIRELKNFGLIFKPKSNNIFIEINKDWFVVFKEKEKCIGGLPTTMSGKAIILISGGIDSAVASFLAMRKGLELIFLHFHNYPSNYTKIIDEKILKLVKKLNDFQIESKIYIISFFEAQKEIIKKIHPKYRMMCYRWLMFKIAEIIAEKENAKVIITGDSLGQVASQTLDNISLIIKNSNLPIFMPLLSFDKAEIIEIAKKIGTYEISIIPYADCCSFMIAKHPATKIEEKKFLELIKNLRIKNIIKKSLNNIRIEKIR